MYKRAAGRPKTKWENYVKEDLRIMTIKNWTKRILDRVKSKDVVQKAKTLKQ